jgi:hypothetical protein
MKVYIIVCEEGGYYTYTSIEEVWLDKNKAHKRADELNCRFPSFRHRVVEREVEEND